MTSTPRFVSLGSVGLVLLHVVFGICFLMGMSALMTGASLLWFGETNRIGAGAAVGLGLVLITASVVFFRFVYITGPRARAYRMKKINGRPCVGRPPAPFRGLSKISTPDDGSGLLFAR